MSRSYKKVPIHKDTGKYTYQDKRNANKIVRHSENIPDGGAFKKLFNSWDISDYQWGEYSWEEAWEYISSSEQRSREFYERVLKKPYTSKEKNLKELKREFHKLIGK